MFYLKEAHSGSVTYLTREGHGHRIRSKVESRVRWVV